MLIQREKLALSDFPISEGGLATPLNPDQVSVMITRSHRLSTLFDRTPNGLLS